MLAIPEVLMLKDRVQAGHFSEEDVLAARDAIGARIQTFLRNAQDPNPPPSGAEPPAEAPPESPRRVRAGVAEQSAVSESDQAIASLSAPPAVADVPPGVSVPGDGVTLPRILRVVPPTYTPEARRAKLEGTVVLMAVVRTHGVAANISVEHSLDDRFGLDAQAVAAVRQWRFAPGERAGRPVPVLVLIYVTFRLP
jgi:TonB family protein